MHRYVLLALIMFPLSLVGNGAADGSPNVSSSASVTNYPELLDASGDRIGEIKLGEKAIIRVTYTNQNEVEQPVVILVEVRDEKGITVYLAWQSRSVAAGMNYTLEASWIPTEICDVSEDSRCNGAYQIRAYAIDNLENPQILDIFGILEVTVLQSREGDKGGDENDSREIAIYALLASEPSLAKYRT
ncbi:MAG: hypothetical protein ACREAQ_09050, partial [Nitrososphaera sp.]